MEELPKKVKEVFEISKTFSDADRQSESKITATFHKTISDGLHRNPVCSNTVVSKMFDLGWRMSAAASQDDGRKLRVWFEKMDNGDSGE